MQKYANSLTLPLRLYDLWTGEKIDSSSSSFRCPFLTTN